MSRAKARPSLLRRLANWLLGTLGVLAILLAVALGVVRLLLGQVPEYQDEIKAWVADELGLVVEFAAIDARLGFTGPELSLRDASIGDSERVGFLRAEQAAITFDPLALVLGFGRRIEVSRLTLAGVQLTVERDAAGTLRIGEHVLAADVGPLPLSVPQSVEIRIRDSTLRYIDAVREREWVFADLEIAVASVDGRLNASVSMRPPAELARRIDIDASASAAATGPDDWQFEAVAEAIDLGGLAELLPVQRAWPLHGTGELSLGARWLAGELQTVEFRAEVADFELGEAGPDNLPFAELVLAGEFAPLAGDGWRLALEEIGVARGDFRWDDSARAGFELTRVDGEIDSVALSADFIRLAELAPVVSQFPQTQLAEQWRLYEPAGEIRDLNFRLGRRGDSLDYELSAAFAGLAVNRAGDMPGISGVSGRIRASEDSGNIEFASGAIALDWPLLFAETVGVESLNGPVAWYQSRDDVRLLSGGLAIGLLGETARAGFDFRLPRDGSSPILSVRTELAAADLVAARRYLPRPLMAESVVSWLDRAVVGGRARDIEFVFEGPVREFPFDDGEGQFLVAAAIEDAVLDYMSEWPLAEELNGRIEFADAGFAASGTGRALSNRAASIAIAIPDLRTGFLSLSAATDGPLTGVVDYLRAAPLIAAHLGPDFNRIEPRGGSGAFTFRLDLPLRDRKAFALDATLAISDGAFAISGFGPGISELSGEFHAREDAVEASGVEAVFLGGPVTAALGRSSRDGYRAELLVDGETSAEAVAASFSLPHEDLLDGQTRWRGRLLLPALDPLATTSTHIVIESNLAGVALRFPAPLSKPPGEPSNLRLDLEFAAGNRLELSGNLGATRRFVLSFQPGDNGLEFERGAVRFGGDEQAPVPPRRPGLLVNGQIETLALDAWLELAESSGLSRAGPIFLGADLEVADFSALGQRLGDTDLRVERGVDNWEIAVDSEPIAGTIRIPHGAGSREPAVAEMSRLYLAANETGTLARLDPRQLPAIRLDADEFAFGARRFGRISATVDADRRGLVLSAFTSETENYRASLSGSWFQGPLRMRTTIAAELSTDNVSAALAELGIDPAISGESAEVTANLFFDEAPGADWLDHLNGDVRLVVETGTLREINPGAGRMLGLMSIATLPRRLALDFRDVFEDGFAFDEIGGSFTLIDGNAYTNDLKFTGPAAEIGVVGRTGLRDRDYTQQVVVSPEPGNVLPTVAGLLAGPGPAAALFVFTRLFKEPLKGIGQASYCLEGSWETPTIEPINNDEQERARQCADLPEALRNDLIDN